MSYREDGDTINSTNLVAVGSTIRTQANAIQEEDIAPGALSHAHLPATFDDVDDLFPNGLMAGFTRLGTSPANPFINYLNAFNTTPFDYQLFHTGVPTQPYGAPGAWDEGWRIPQNPGTTERPEIITTSSRIDTHGYAGIHVTGSVNVGSVSGDSYLLDESQAMASALIDVCVIAAIGWRDGGGTRHVKASSIRAVSQKNKVQRLTVQHFLTQADLNTGDGTMQSIFLVTAAVGLRTFYNVNMVDRTYSIAGCQLSALPLHAEELS